MLGLLDDALGVQHPSAVALDIQGLQFGGNLILGFEFEF
jgi:hypothetical protein